MSEQSEELPTEVAGNKPKKKRLTRTAIMVIAVGTLESFSVNFSLLGTFIWLTTEFLPKTYLNPATTSTIFMALSGLTIFLLAKQIGRTADSFKPYRLFLSTQVMNLIILPALALLVALASPKYPFVGLSVLFILDLLLSVRAVTYDSAVNVFIAHQVDSDKQTDYYSWNFRANLLATFFAPLAAAYAAQLSIYLALGIGGIFTLICIAILLTKPYRRLETYEYGDRISWTAREWLGAFSVQPEVLDEPQSELANTDAPPSESKTAEPLDDKAPLQDEQSEEAKAPQVSGLASLRYVKYVNFILLCALLEALGNRSREAFNVYFITETFGRDVGDLGVLTTTMTVGLVIGTTLSEWTRRKIRWKLLPSAVYVLFGVAFLAKGLATAWWQVLLFTVCEGIFVGLNAGIFQAMKMHYTPSHLVGSTSSAFRAMFQGFSTAGLGLWAAYAWIGSRIGHDFMATHGYRIAFIVGGLFICCAGLVSVKLYGNFNWQKS